MDTSSEYIKMCEKAEEIQLLADKYNDQWSVGAWYAPNHVRCKGHFEDWHMRYKYCPVCRKPLETPAYSICRYLKGDSSIWLPHQDQLQAMLPEFISKAGFVPSVASSFADFVCDLLVYPLPFRTFEQSWLAFVMSERYQKVWNGEDWVIK